jgi:D-alanyl-D-alanine endopeptidase (penicillin-binding protein 7)
MDTENLGQLATRTRFMREAGIALLIGSAVLMLLLFVPLRSPSGGASAVVTAVPAPDAYHDVSVAAGAAIVYDLVTGETLYAKNSDAQLPLASLTKLLTIEAAVRELAPGMAIIITPVDETVDSPHRFKAGDTLAFNDLARLTLTASLNDGASAIISAIEEREATSTPAVLAGVAAELGLSSTYAVNGNGLDVSALISGGYGSARDMALLAGALVHDAPDIALATTLPKASATTAAGKHYEILNTNPTVANAPRLLLSKTGFTDLAGGNLALVFDASINHPIAVVVLGSTEEARFTDATVLIAATLAHFAGIASL